MKGLAVHDASVRYGGLTALDGVSLEAPRGRITGLIGPNGAGKTTLFNACTGLIPLSGGEILLDGEDLRHAPPAERGRRGLGRTFQRLELWDDLSVAENVALGREAAMAGNSVIRQLVTGRGQRRAVADASAEAIHRCGIAPLAERPAGSLSTGQRRLVELARALAGAFTMLLLDEPSSGLDRVETEQFGEILRGAMEDRDLGILIVEHDMALVMSVCSHIYVIEFGKPVFDGGPSDVQASDVVRAAYLGAEASV